MSALNIVHITPTPLVGAPGKISWSQKMVGHHSIAVAFNDYPQNGPLAKKFLDKTLVIDDFTKTYVEDRIKEADIIHVHNFLPVGRADWLKNLNQSAKYVYQAHSPLREGPLYLSRSDIGDIEYDVKLAVGQYHGRHYQDFIQVPNITLSPPSVVLRGDNELLRVMFSPTHKQPGRWNSKHSDVLLDVLEKLRQIGKIELIFPSQPVSPETLMDVRRNCHVSIDEIATGAFHMVSLEGMCAGNIVVNRADFFAKAAFAGFCDGVMPPFEYCDDGNIADTLLSYANSAKLTRTKQLETINFYKAYCAPTRLVEFINATY